MKGKRIILSVFLCLLMCFSTKVNANTDIYVTSDTHIGPSNVTLSDCNTNNTNNRAYYCINGGKDNPTMTNATRLSQFLKAINLTGATDRYLLVVGDVIQIYQTDKYPNDDAYQNYKNIISSSANNSNINKVFTSIGNHELRPSSDEKEIDETRYDNKRNAFINNFGAITDTTTFGNTIPVKIIRIGTDYDNRPVIPWTGESSSDESRKSSLYAYTSETTLTTLRRELNDALEHKQTVIVMTHWPLNDTVEASWNSSGTGDGVPYRYNYIDENTGTLPRDDRVKNMIKEYPNVIVVSGHSHWYFNKSWKLKDSGNSLYLHDGCGIKGTKNNLGTDFLKISFSDKKTARIYPQELNAAGTAITNPTAEAHTYIDYVNAFDWSWATVNYDANGGTGTAPATTYKYGSILENTYTKTGHTSESWNTKADGTGTTYMPEEEVTWTGADDYNLYAQWRKNKLSIRYHANGGTLKADHGEEITLESDVIYRNGNDLFHTASYGGSLSSDGLWNYDNPNYINLEKEGYFVNPNQAWTDNMTEFSQTIQYTVEEIADLTSSDRTADLYVNWIPEGYNITYNLDGGEANNKIKYTIETDTFTLNEPTKAGYRFVGWTGSNGNIPQKTVTIEKGTTGDKSYTAHYEKLYTLSFDSNGGSNVSAIEAGYGDDIAEPTAPTKTGNTFKGWYSDSNLTNIFVFDTMPNHDVTLYAKWEKSKYQVVFDSNGGSTVENQEVEYQSKATRPADPTKTGQIFKGWYSDSGLTTEYDFNDEVTSSIILYAKWSSTEYNITYNLDGGTANNPTTYTSETATFTLNEPTKTGHTFVGWTGSNGSTPQKTVTIEQGSTGDRTYIATYALLTYHVSFETNGGNGI